MLCCPTLLRDLREGNHDGHLRQAADTAVHNLCNNSTATLIPVSELGLVA